MKKVRLEVPLIKKNELDGSKRFFLKVGDNITEAFYDKDCKKPISEKEPRINLDTEIPDEIDLIAVAAPCKYDVCQEIAEAWFTMIRIINRFVGLKKLLVIGQDNIHEVEICNGRPNIEQWLSNKENSWWCNMSWALVVYIYENKSESHGVLRWNSNLALVK